MRIVGMLTMTALILTGLPPSPISGAPAQTCKSRHSQVNVSRGLAPSNLGRRVSSVVVASVRWRLAWL